MRKGKVRVDFYTQRQEYRKSRVLGAGDVILLIAGGHGFEVLEEVNMVEVKQGPYFGDTDKTRFVAAMPPKLNFEYRASSLSLPPSSTPPRNNIPSIPSIPPG